jgi:hypothetical protein
LVATRGKSCEQGLVGKDIDAAGEAQRTLRDHFQRGLREDTGAAIPGSAHPEIEVMTDVVMHQRREAEVMRDALFQLAHVRAGKDIVQFRLAEKHQLQQLVAVGLEVRQQAYFLERFHRHGVRFVDQHHDLATFAEGLDQVILKRAHDGRRAGALGHVQAQFVGNGIQDVVTRQRRVGEVNDRDVFRQTFHQYPAQHCLATADLSADLDDAFVVGNRIDQGVKRRAPICPVEEEVGMRCDAEGWFVESEVFQVHVVGSYCGVPRFSRVRVSIRL